MSTSWQHIWLGFALILLVGVPALPAHGQSESGAQHTMMFRGVALSEALPQIAETTNANLVYDADMVTGERVYCSAKNAPVPALLRCVLSDVPIDFFQTSAGTYVLTPSPRQKPRRGHLTGRVVDAQTGEPLRHANVLLAAANTGVATGTGGRFQLPNLSAGRYRVVASHLGYEATAQTVRVQGGDSTHKQISLHPRPISTEPVIVTQSSRMDTGEGLGSSTVSSAELTRPSSYGTPDALGRASTLLGVHAQRPLADLHVQGGATGEHQVRLDGTPVRNPVTLRRMLGAFSPLGLSHLTVRKAGYGVEHGSTISGVLDARHALSTASPEVGQVQIDPLSVNAEVHESMSLGSGQSAQVRVAGRTNLWDIYQDPTLNTLLRDWNVVDPMLLQTYFGDGDHLPIVPQAQTSSLSYSDLHGVARVDLGPYRSLRVSGYRGSNRLESEFVATAPAEENPEDGSSMLTQDGYSWTNRAVQARLDWMLGPRTSTSLQLRASQQNVHRAYQMSYASSDLVSSGNEPSAAADTLRDTLDPDRWPDDHNRIRELSAKGTGSYSFSARHHFKAAVSVSHFSTRFSLGNRFFRPMTFDDSRWQVGGYLRDVFSLSARATLNVGTRLTYVPARQTVYAEPRLVARYQGTGPNIGEYAVRFGGGVYRQFVHRFDVTSTSPTSILPSVRFWLPAGPNHAPPRAYHATLSGRIQPHSHWNIIAEGYLKHYPHLLALDYSAFRGPRTSPVAPSRAIAGTQGHALGAGVSISRKGPVFESTLRYDWSRSRRQFPSRFNGDTVPTPWTQPHRVVVSGRAKTPLGLTFSTQAVYAAGQSWGFRRTYYDYLSIQPDSPSISRPSFQNPGQNTLAHTLRLDAGVTYSLQVETATLETRLSVTNLLDRQNPFDWGLKPSADGPVRTTRSLPGRHLTGSISIRY